MPLAYYLAAVDTMLACLVTMAMGGWTAYQRGKHKIEAPAVVGHPQFERAHRAHLNTVENLVLMIRFCGSRARSTAARFRSGSGFSGW